MTIAMYMYVFACVCVLLLEHNDSSCRSVNSWAAILATIWTSVRCCLPRKCSPKSRTRWCRTWRNTTWNQILQWPPKQIKRYLDLAKPLQLQKLYSLTPTWPHLPLPWCIVRKLTWTGVVHITEHTDRTICYKCYNIMQWRRQMQVKHTTGLHTKNLSISISLALNKLCCSLSSGLFFGMDIQAKAALYASCLIYPFPSQRPSELSGSASISLTPSGKSGVGRWTCPPQSTPWRRPRLFG